MDITHSRSMNKAHASRAYAVRWVVYHVSYLLTVRFWSSVCSDMLTWHIHT